MINRILRNAGEESDLTALTNLTSIQQVAFDKLTEAVQDVCVDESTQYKFLEKEGSITLVTGSYKYAKATVASDMQLYDRRSFVQPDSGNKVIFKTPQEWDELYPSGITSTVTGYPDNFMEFAGYFVLNKQATATENGKLVNFRYWRQPTLPDTATPSGTLDIPEPFDRLVLVSLATLKLLAYLGSDDAIIYHGQVFGDSSKGQDGSMQKLIDAYASPDLKMRLSLNAG